MHDAVVIGSGPNGLAAAIVLARAGRKVLVREGSAIVGGSCRSANLTLPGYTHDVCAAVPALAPLSPFMKSLPLGAYGCEFLRPAAAFAHPMDDGTAAAMFASTTQTASALGADGPSWEKHFGGILRRWDQLIPDLLAPLRMPRRPLLLAKFGMSAIRSARGMAEGWFKGANARALFAGAAAHAGTPLEWKATAAIGLVLALSAHAAGWPIVRGGSQKLADAMADYFRFLGGEIEVNSQVKNVDELSGVKAILCDMSPRQLIAIAGHRLPGQYCRRLRRFVAGPGAWKVDWALDGPIPWTARVCAQAGAVHVGGTLEEIAAAERAPWNGRHAERPFVLLVQPTLLDPSRAPPGKHTAWAYCHVPNGSNFDMTERIESQIERFAPGFGRLILARGVMSPSRLELHNPNLIGGDVGGGANIFSQLLTRPVARADPYSTPARGLYLCSASTPPGGGVHGMCGYWAAQSALRKELR
ncbi:MAG TPA: NAD(P)/FAD-dependent oxidoreductase [Tepidisphaeraceae bacterium]|nr:NAD(P)/FAD-dependent oxidoreductase [Tepidisphaeraceae bacterium]